MGATSAERKFSFDLTRKTVRAYWRASIRYPWQLLLVMGGVVGYTILVTYVPLLYRDLIDLMATGQSQDIMDGVFRLIVIIFAFNFLRTSIWRVALWVNSNFQPRVMADLTNTCYQYLQKHSASFFNSSFVGSLVTKVKRYERSFETVADQLTFEIGRSVFEVATIFAVFFWEYRTAGWIVAGWAAAFFVFTIFMVRFKLPYNIRRAASDSETTAQLADSLTNNSNTKLFSNYALENKRFGDVTENQYRLRRLTWRLDTVADAVQSISMILIEFVVMWWAIRGWQRGVIQVGDIAVLQLYLARIFEKLWSTGRNIQRIYEALADANEMTEILTKPYEIKDAPLAAVLRAQAGEIVFQDVTFQYVGRVSVLKKFNLKIAAGEKLAFVGPSGGGKSTILRLLLRLHDVQNGTITIDGQEVSKVTQDSLRAAIAFVPQEPILFHRSLLENIRYARPEAKDEEVIRAAKLAHAHEFIVSFPEGYQTLVGERGVKLSGGERQRVAIARAILKDAPILMLDEATSSLDSESEMYIQDALRTLMKGRTTIVVAHRLSTIMQMDRIVVIENGKILEEGKHKELLKARRGVYQKLWNIQAGGFAAR